MTTVLLGGEASPLGWSVQYVHAPFDDVLPRLVAWRRGLGQDLEVAAPRPFVAALEALLPFEAPWTRELVLPCGAWTAYLNSFVNGGDLTASAVVVATGLGVRWVGAQHTPRWGPGHQATQLWVHGPHDGPSLRAERVLAAVAEDGRWSWDELGAPFAFEDPARYRARRIRDRFDRALLIEYLEALGIPAGDDAAYGPGVVVQQRVVWQREGQQRTQTLAEARAYLGPT